MPGPPLSSPYRCLTLTQDTSNTHFMLFEFSKEAAGAGAHPKVRADLTKRAVGLLKPCIYKKR